MSRRPKKNIYHIILTSNGKQIKNIYNCQSERLVNEKFKNLIEENKKIRFPVRFINVGKLVDALLVEGDASALPHFLTYP